MTPTILSSTLLIAVLLASSSLRAETPASPDPRSGPLYEALARMDRELFEVAFVRCDGERFAELFTEDAEFYHDLAGPSFGESVRTLKSCPADRGVRRVLVEASLEVHPMKDYGAVQQGVHWFVEEGAATSTRARFIHLWREVDGTWRLARVISYDHQSRPREEAPR